MDGEERTLSSQIYDAQVGYRGDGSIIIDGNITNEDGEQVGFMQREFFKENGGVSFVSFTNKNNQWQFPPWTK